MTNLIPSPQKCRRSNGIVRLPGRLSVYRNFESLAVEAVLKKLGGSVARTDSHSGAFLKLVVEKSVPELRGIRPVLKQHGYVLEIQPSVISISAVSQQGVFYGLQTLIQMLQTGPALPAVKITDWPDMPYRGVHCMMGGGTMSFEMMKKCVERMARYKMTHIVLEYDNRFPWERHPLIAHPASYTKQQIRELIRIGRANFVEITPCLDSLGHADHYLGPDKYAHLRENPARSNDLCATDPKAMKFMQELWEEVLDLHAEAEYAHITGDEVWHSGQLCRSKGKGSLPGLYRKWYLDLSRWIIARGKKPMMWNDMFVKYPESLKGFPNDVTICDWCYEAPDQPYKTDQIYFMRADENGVVDPLQKKTFGKYWLYKGNKTRFNNFPYVRFFADKGFEVVGSTASSHTGVPCVIPCQAERFINNKRFAMEVKAQKGAGLLVTWWSNELPMESAWAGMLAGADQSWHVRDEGPGAFLARFGANFLSMRRDETKTLSVLDTHFFRIGKNLSGYLGEMWVADPQTAETAAVLHEVQSRNTLNAEFKSLMNANAELVRLQSEIGRIYNRINQLRTGAAGRDTPIDIHRFANRSFYGSLPVNATTHWNVLPADTRVSGVRIRTIDAKTNNGASVVTIRGARNPRAPVSVQGIPLNMRADRVFLFYSGYDIGVSGQHIADIIFKYEDGKTDKLPVTEGVNILDWNAKGGFNKPLPGAVVAWAVEYRYFYMGWWINKRPDSKIISIDVVSAGNPGYLILGGITARVDDKRVCVQAEARTLLKELKKHNPALNRWRRNLDSAFKGVLAKPEFDAHKGNWIISKKVTAWQKFYTDSLDGLTDK